MKISLHCQVRENRPPKLTSTQQHPSAANKAERCKRQSAFPFRQEVQIVKCLTDRVKLPSTCSGYFIEDAPSGCGLFGLAALIPDFMGSLPLFLALGFQEQGRSSCWMYTHQQMNFHDLYCKQVWLAWPCKFGSRHHSEPLAPPRTWLPGKGRHMQR